MFQWKRAGGYGKQNKSDCIEMTSFPYVDAHCHLSTDRIVSHGFGYSNSDSFNYVEYRDVLRCVMSNNQFDLMKVKKIRNNSMLIRSFGIHPWYSHLFTLKDDIGKLEHYREVLQWKDEQEFQKLVEALPPPLKLQQYIDDNFNANEFDVIGEIGLDKLFRLPDNGFYTSVDTGRLTRTQVKISHQVNVFHAMLQLSKQYQLPISVHDVKCHQVLFESVYDILGDQDAINICLHSYTGSVEMLGHFWFKKFNQNRVFLSFSGFINFSNSATAMPLLQSIPKESILTETDFPIDLQTEQELQLEIKKVYNGIREILQFESEDALRALVYNNTQRFLKRDVEQ
ncbi:hypothetical protein TPHA_0I00480 [Tetrapisispora phaffii CBS 4417]|uniref:Amidohydrolase-related domain-containing protein n=1 Tax=Tetrapisispora phaffii (strain ATCC 24235 / CBS 4417 / NBRC 1672 / NRRL Y-8282 / UCD 70-5) TaxID=1071381 RepID=G8BXC6_TETPH|nr:hypothetical protein TPHA_0I00480 [Tetrapisispora phaffii CBS 4417]CCE64554.1 hypothetical protein TPHA_0I00480 [Tetrapisispora phaffii CBS 4417]